MLLIVRIYIYLIWEVESLKCQSCCPVQEFVAERHLWQPFWGWKPDLTECLLQASNTGSDRNLCSGGFKAGSLRDLFQAYGAEWRDQGHDPQNPGLRSHHNLSPRLQGIRIQSLTPDLRPCSVPCPIPSLHTCLGLLLSSHWSLKASLTYGTDHTMPLPVNNLPEYHTFRCAAILWECALCGPLEPWFLLH